MARRPEDRHSKPREKFGPLESLAAERPSLRASLPACRGNASSRKPALTTCQRVKRGRQKSSRAAIGVPALGVQGALSELRLGNGHAGQGAGRSVATGRWASACLCPHGTASAPRRRDAHGLPLRARRAGAAAGGCCTSPPCGEARRSTPGRRGRGPGEACDSEARREPRWARGPSRRGRCAATARGHAKATGDQVRGPNPSPLTVPSPSTA